MMRPYVLFFALALLAIPSAVRAQDPVTGPDPTPDDIELYELAADSAIDADADQVVLLDEGYVVVEEEGVVRATYRTVVHVRTRDAVATNAEQVLTWDGATSTGAYNWARVVTPDGTVLEDAPIHQEASTLPTFGSEPVYSDTRQVRISLSGVEPGSIVDVSYTYEYEERIRHGDFLQAWLISSADEVRRSRLTVDVPAGFDFRIVASEGAPSYDLATTDGRDLYTWSARDQPPFEAEPFAPFENDEFHWVQVASAGSWADIGAWYAELLDDPWAITDDVRAAADSVIGEAEGRDALRALHRWIVDDFRYVSVALGERGYVPQAAADVLRTRSGDCKDKAALFIGLARALGFEAFPVLLSDGGLDERVPALTQLNHMIAAVRVDDAWVWADLTTDVVPFGGVPLSYAGEFGMIVLDDGSTHEVEFPSDEWASTTITEFEGGLTEDGLLTGRIELRADGAAAQQLRGMFGFLDPEEPEFMEDFADGFAGALFAGATGSDVVLEGMDDPDTPVRIAMNLEASRVTRPARGAGLWLETPLAPEADPTFVRQLEREAADRRLPVESEQVIGPVLEDTRIEIALPEGWLADLPPSVTVDSRFGHYESSYTQEGRIMRLRRMSNGTTGVFEPESIQELVEFYQAVLDDDARLIFVGPGG